jgi:RNA polymerase sigma-70 factor (family 1)
MQSRASEDEEILLNEIAIGDHRAFRILFDLYKDKVYSYSLRFLRNETLAEEIVQEVFINLWLKRDRLPAIVNFGGYLRVLTKNQTLNALKKLALDFKTSIAGGDIWTELDNDTEDAIILKDTRALLQEAIDQLPKQQKLVYEFCKIEGLKQKEAAERLNISPLTVKVHLREATKSIRKFMADRTELQALLPLFIYMLK